MVVMRAIGDADGDCNDTYMCQCRNLLRTQMGHWEVAMYGKTKDLNGVAKVRTLVGGRF